MPFVNVEMRSAMAKRLSEIAHAMLRARDQGQDGRFYASDKDIEDIWAAAVIVSEARIGKPAPPQK